MLGIRLGDYAITVQGLGRDREVRWSVLRIHGRELLAPLASGALLTRAGDGLAPTRVVVSALEIGCAVARDLSRSEGRSSR
jgi:hypothetical protein